VTLSQPTRHSPRRLAVAAITIAAAALTFAAAHASATTVPAGDAAAGECAGADAAALADLTALEAVAAVDELSTLSAAFAASAIGEQLAGDGPFIVFAPSNAAMDEIPANVFDAILADPELLDSVLAHHVVAGQASGPDELTAAGSLPTLEGTLVFAVDGDTLVLNGGEATVTCGPLLTANAAVYVIDRVLQPAEATPAGCPGASSVPSSSTPGASVPDSSVPGSSVPDSSTPGSSVPC
jgi:uncharacterized surface protein with fasciclin (FAS1) repeats